MNTNISFHSKFERQQLYVFKIRISRTNSIASQMNSKIEHHFIFERKQVILTWQNVFLKSCNKGERKK